jgi:hypothetical protein
VLCVLNGITECQYRVHIRLAFRTSGRRFLTHLTLDGFAGLSKVVPGDPAEDLEDSWCARQTVVTLFWIEGRHLMPH